MLHEIHKRILLGHYEGEMKDQANNPYKKLGAYTTGLLRPFLADLARSKDPEILAIATDLNQLALSRLCVLDRALSDLATTSLLSVFVHMSDEQKTNTLPRLIQHEHISSKPINLRLIEDMLVSDNDRLRQIIPSSNKDSLDLSNVINSLEVARSLKI